MEGTQKYWVTVVSKDHAMRGVAGGFTQVNHGKQAPLKKMSPNDWIIIYSPRQSLEGDVKLQAFTAIGQVSDEDIYQHKMSETFIPFRRNIKFYDCIETPIVPLIPDLDFIKNKQSWGYAFRFGFFEIDKADFELISKHLLKAEDSAKA
jgi:predicted RNA-binding protein